VSTAASPSTRWLTRLRELAAAEHVDVPRAAERKVLKRGVWLKQTPEQFFAAVQAALPAAAERATREREAQMTQPTR
jgi:hypothetical protein